MSTVRSLVRRRGGVARRPPEPRPDAREQTAQDRVLSLQRQAGNRAVTGLLTRNAARPPGLPVRQRAPATLSFRNLSLGTNAAGGLVKVTRVLGSEAGYPSRWQATAVARLAKAEPAAVVQRRDTKAWCAVEVSASLSTGKVGATAGGVRRSRRCTDCRR